MPAKDGHGRASAIPPSLVIAASALLRHVRVRRHIAVLAAIVAVVAFGYGLLNPRNVLVLADGQHMVIETHESSDAAVLNQAGVELQPGDRVTALDGDGARVLRVDRARLVHLEVDGVTYQMLTHAQTVDQLLAEANVAVEGRDSVLVDGALVPPNADINGRPALAVAEAFASASGAAEARVEVRRAVRLTIVEDGNAVETTSSRETVSQALREAGVIVGPGDRVEPALDAALASGMSIDVRHARPVTIALPDGHRVVYTLSSTVGEALAEAGVALPEGAFVDPPLETPVTAGLSVRVVQLAAGNEVEYEYIASSTRYESDPALAPGQTRTVQGHDGVLVRRYEITYVNGEEFGRTLVDEYYDPEPQDTIIYYPTRTGRNDAAPAAGSGAVSRVLRMYATYYTPASSGRSPDDPNYGVTATGVVVTYGVVAVDPNVIPLGTRLFIPGYGYAVAADTGGAVKGNIIDLGFPDGVEVDWQSQWVDVYILE
ncbi:MAG TPA: ubiquitin-like domain-containing protein [Dehalococcoidia bacterium]|nr:ubiquitin-like domain-containing protein [Dehalococcoidia bacterium]